MEQWLAVADEIRRDRCHVQILIISMLQATRSEATETVQAVASAIRWDRNLEHLVIQMRKGFTEEARVALEEALTVTATLRLLLLSLNSVSGGQVHDPDAFSAPAYDTFSAMLRVNTSLTLRIPPFDDTVGDERLVDSRYQMIIEQRLNQVGRGRLLASRQTSREDWVDALEELSSTFVGDPSALQVSYLFSLPRLNPSVVCSS